MPLHHRISAALVALSLIGCSTALTQESESKPDAQKHALTPLQHLESPAKRKITYTAIRTDKPFIAITFDDGPSGSLTPKLLDILKERRIKATFFMCGEMVVENPDIVKRMIVEGHEVANHSWNHPNLARMNRETVRSQLVRTNDAIEKACGVRPTVMRPPYGNFTEAQRSWCLEDLGMPTILWSVDPLDWKNRNSAIVRDRIVSNTKAGGIILCHDIHATTVNAMASTLDQLLARGFQFFTVSDLIAMDQPEPEPTPSPVPTPTPVAEPGTASTSGEPTVTTNGAPVPTPAKSTKKGKSKKTDDR